MTLLLILTAVLFAVAVLADGPWVTDDPDLDQLDRELREKEGRR